ncbi:MAG: ROK family protein [Ignavibacteriaceae bacterium]|nr:ROK family protein [Ignavibacteriaceae bacterium]
MTKKYIISIDMGGTKILGAAINSNEGILARIKQPTKEGAAPDEYISAIVEVVNELIADKKFKPESIQAVCLGVPGSVNPETGIIGLAPNLGLKNFSIKEKLQEKIELPVLIENDVNLAAMGIKNFELDEKAKNILVVFVGTGIGGGLLFNGKIYRGSSFVAGEIGHRVVEKNGALCGCGNKGCFEALASRTAIVKSIINDINSGKKSFLTERVKNGERIKSKMLRAAVKADDVMVKNHIQNASVYIGRVLADINNLLNLDTIVLGGGVIEAVGKFMLPTIKKTFEENVLQDSAVTTKIKMTKLGDDAALFGGISLAEEFLNILV